MHSRHENAPELQELTGTTERIDTPVEDSFEVDFEETSEEEEEDEEEEDDEDEDEDEAASDDYDDEYLFSDEDDE